MRVSKCQSWLLMVLAAFPTSAQVPAQLDFRFRDSFVLPGQQQKFVRFTLLPKGWFVDIIHSKNGKTVSGRYGAGPLVINRKNWEVYLAVSFSPSTTRSLVVGQGTQIYWNRPKTRRFPKMKMSSPILELYQELYQGKALHGVKENEQLLVFLTPRLAVGQETFINKPFGQKMSGYYGPTVGLWPAKKAMLEAGALRTFSGDWIFRARLVINFKIAFGH